MNETGSANHAVLVILEVSAIHDQDQFKAYQLHAREQIGKRGGAVVARGGSPVVGLASVSVTARSEMAIGKGISRLAGERGIPAASIDPTEKCVHTDRHRAAGWPTALSSRTPARKGAAVRRHQRDCARMKRRISSPTSCCGEPRLCTVDTWL